MQPQEKAPLINQTLFDHFAADDQLRQKYFEILLRPKNSTRIFRKKKFMARRSSGDNSQGIHSSLALLQERFNQLQKTREMRQERELMRLISEAQERHAAFSSSSSSNNKNCISNSFTTMHYDHHHQPSMSYDSELAIFHQQRPSSQLGLSLWPDYSHLNRPVNYGDEEGGASAQETKSWLFGTNLGLQTPIKFDHDSTTAASDVDTSLRLGLTN